MKRKSMLFALLMTGAMVLSACSSGTKDAKSEEKAADDSKKTLKVATEGNMYPWTYTENGKIVGYEADMMEEISKRTGYEIEMEAVDWSGIFGALDAGRVDTIADIITITDERIDKYEFTQPYIYNPMVLATKSSITDVENGRVALWIGGKPSLTVQINEGEFDLKIVGETGYYQKYAYPFPKTEEGKALCKEFDKALTEMREDGTLKKISEKWFNMDITTEDSVE